MSTYFKENNNESSKMLFYKKGVYSNRMIPFAAIYPNLMDFNRGEKFLYGRVSRNFIPMITTSDSMRKSFKKASGQGSAAGQSALDFVVDAFSALALQFEKCAYSGKIDPNDPYLSTLTVYKAYQNPVTLYEQYKMGYFNGIAASFRSTGVKVKNFDDFIHNLMIMLKSAAYSVPFTMTAFVKSRRCPINISGLAVEIAFISAANDDEKMNLFVNSKNWEFYLNACKSYGFMVDQSTPWRLVADIGSSAMLEYASAYREDEGHNTTDGILRAYLECHSQYYSRFENDLLQLYELCREKTIVETEECSGQTITRYVQPMQYTLQQLKALYPERYFLNLYFNIRLYEDENALSEAEKYSLIRDSLDLFDTNPGANPYDVSALPRALYFFERIINKPFDYRGSLTYNNIKHIPARLEAEAEEEEIPISSNGSTSGMGSGGGY